ncbi:uncharacterized protein LOC117570616 [Drosophila albomicans]|uniref:Uncharacterized protein LOC117570616 n=1 Tax=Drosophila albomicans TaxID=7291 RepID=A0A6P8X8H1_DROAB|nr:uncharacterized protein LOC117570616 [Drosophila albomicans]
MLNGSLIILLLCVFCATINATPTSSRLARSAHLQEDVQLLHPHVITIERLEHLLRRAGEIFGPAVMQNEDAQTSASEVQPQIQIHPQPHPQPQPYMLPPTEQPYNFYLPLFDYVDPKLDAKSKRMEKIAPPPHRVQQERNYYADKPKKTPKKFNADAKHINMKWLNTYEKAMGGNTPKAVYLEQDERSRINFDDSFFAVDMHVKTPDNQPHVNVPGELMQHGEQLPEDDLMAAPAHQLAYNFKPTGA